MKNDVNELAILGGQPDFAEKLHIGFPNIGDRKKFLQRLNDILDRKWLTNNGVYVQEFEQRIAELLGVQNCIAVTNGTIALELAIRALNLSGEVILPSFTFIATAHALQWQQIKPVFCDIDPKTHHIDPGQIERLITPLTTAILGVHVWGKPCDVEALDDIAKQNKLNLLYDAAHAFYSSFQGRMVGNFGDAEVFSFHATKFCNSFEGGAITTNNNELANKIRLMRNFGFSGLDNVIHIGTNGKMSEVSAAMGLTSLESLSNFVDKNRQNYEQYQLELDNIPGVKLYQFKSNEINNYQYIVLELDENITGISRDLLIEVLFAENVLARRYFHPGCHQMEPYRSYQPHAGLLLPETNALSAHVLVLPTGTGISSEDIEKICQLLRLTIANGHLVTESIKMKNNKTGF